ncbi:UNKNOWN [Stylonychia lemnae]|uniref:Uncharacterized protein n=1 Tax=Stylonychia lemnae TaxID=5949 RepID=A0A078A8W1_STYLE|nr:UNKNOWN [Stylonychia lemnae]|eukprot:CDW77982.1 UNKNOWN [Stylonychia lemnae]
MESQSTAGLVLISKLYNEGLINDKDRDNLKDMVFNEDSTLLTLIEKYSEDEQYLREAILKYVHGGNMRMTQCQRVSIKVDSSDIHQLSSPTDSAIDMKKMRRLNQLQQEQLKYEQLEQQENLMPAASKQNNISLGMKGCDLGCSPQMSKNSLVPKKKMVQGRLSPLGVQSRQFLFDQNMLH